METVGVGQSELDIARAADSTVVIMVPESGDSIQTLKAGLMEIADIFVVNKADRPGADRMRTDIELMLGMRAGEALRNVPAHHGVDLKKIMNPARIAREAAAGEQTHVWTPPVLRTVAAKGEGMDDLITALDRHYRYLEASGELRRRRRQRLREQVIDVTEHKLRQRLWRDDGTNAFVDAALPALESGDATPFTVADELLTRSVHLLTRTRP
jgi:LAO/AO transport system kinase